MTEVNELAGIDSALVDDVVIGAMALLIEGEMCHASTDVPVGPDDVSMAVYCDSDQQSAVVLRCNHSLAQRLTCSMLEMEQNEVADADILDATGEVVNVIAGNLRGLLPTLGSMSAPFMVDGAAYQQLSRGVSNTYRMHGAALQVLRV